MPALIEIETYQVEPDEFGDTWEADLKLDGEYADNFEGSGRFTTEEDVKMYMEDIVKRYERSNIMKYNTSCIYCSCNDIPEQEQYFICDVCGDYMCEECKQSHTEPEYHILNPPNGADCLCDTCVEY